MLRNCLTKKCKSFDYHVNDVVLHGDVSCVLVLIYCIILMLF